MSFSKDRNRQKTKKIWAPSSGAGLDEPNAVPMYDIYAQVAYALKGSDVQTVVIGGRMVMRDRKLLTVNEVEAIAKAREYKKSIAASLGMQ